MPLGDHERVHLEYLEQRGAVKKTGIILAHPHVWKCSGEGIDANFILQQTVSTGNVAQGPVHLATGACSAIARFLGHGIAGHHLVDHFLGREASPGTIGALGLDDGKVAVLLGLGQCHPCFQEPGADLLGRGRVCKIAHQFSLLESGGHKFGNDFATLLIIVIDQTQVMVSRKIRLGESLVRRMSLVIHGGSPFESASRTRRTLAARSCIENGF